MMKSVIPGMLVMIVLITGCSLTPIESDPIPIGNVESTPTLDPTQFAAERYPAAGVLYQWGLSAEASTEFANPEWGAEQVAGEPDAPGCGDYQFAWASAASDSIATLEVTFSTSVYPLEIVIHESYNPDQVVKVEVFDQETGGYYAVVQKNPARVDRPCPYQLVVPVDGIDFRTNLVRITVDQSQLGLGWNEIDAVQLIGTFNNP
ncbi:MAG: hypothetical protein J7L35_09705 [Anaerolineales bacterium]|nr:hypothetical protein [Anaerolineales bacterium]